jgi:putative transposase
VRRAYKFRLRPTAKQHVALGQCLDAHRTLYNAGLQERRDAYDVVVRRSPHYFSTLRPKGPVNYGRQSAQLREIRELVADQDTWSFSSQQATLRQLNWAFESFFRRVTSGETPGYPRFKPAHRFDSVLWPKDGDGAKWVPETGRVYLQGIGHVKVTRHRQVEGRVKTIQAKREGRHWYLILSCDDVPTKPLEPTGAVVGIDVGIAHFLVTSDGDFVDNPRHASVGGRLADAQQVLDRKQRGSNNRCAAREVVANRHRKIANQRKDFHHQVARQLVEEFDLLVVEALTVKNMTKRAKVKSDPENPGQFLANGGSAKTGLNRSINDAGWAQFRSILEAKAEEAGRTVVSVNPRHTSQTCHECGHVDAGNRVNQAEFLCRRCGHETHADINAARNILGAGLALLVAQAA